ncbi:ABC transporter permease [Saccharopolyspora sp. 5N708]|uniref:ABC transporter permease n=1 Tax=Saccharopolyspora sp. 5N708 TaxID=3457424 RepID=UPI003FD5BBB8
MTWLAWRQHRTGIAAFAAVFLGLAAFYLCCEPLAAVPEGSALVRILAAVESYGRLLLLPLLVGIFVGAPVVARELDSRTFRFSWTQGISRARWLRTKILIAGGAVLLLSTACAVAHMWLFRPEAPTTGWFRIFNQAAPVFPASCLFAFALGVLYGTALRGMIPAMAATLATSAAVFIAVSQLRSSYQTPIRSTAPAPELGAPAPPGALVIGERFEGDRYVRLFHPADRYWTFQFVETGIYLALGALCLATAFWWLRRKLT